MTDKHSSVDITTDEVEAIQTLAAKLGYIQTRGGGRGRGSMAQLMRAIAKGELTVGRPKQEEK